MASQKNNSSELKITRIYDAPVEAVWGAWTDPEQAAKWWGPRGFTITTHSKDLRVGGTWHYTMHGPDGVDYPNKAKYLEVEPLSKLVYDHGGYDDRPPLFRVSVTFKENQGKTRMDMTMTVSSPEALEEIKKIIRKAGGNATWDRLAEYLSAKISNKQTFVINRSFEIPIQTMFDMWTNPDHLSQWLPPVGFKMELLKADIRTGGQSFYCMSNEGGLKMYGRAHYLEISKSNRLVYTQQFCDEKNEKATRHPLAPTWPETMLTVVTFTEEGPDQTRVTVQWEPHEQFSPEELNTFIQSRGGMTQGWTGSFDKLEDYISNHSHYYASHKGR